MGTVSSFFADQVDGGGARMPFAHDWVHLFRFRAAPIQLLKEYIDTAEVSTALAP
jgi:hypothetical protein